MISFGTFRKLLTYKIKEVHPNNHSCLFVYFPFWKDQIILPLVWNILADFWVPHEINSWNFQHLLDLGFHETSKKDAQLSKWAQILRPFIKSIAKQFLKISAVYFMWNPEICQDAPNQGQDDLVLLSSKNSFFNVF